MNIKWNEVTWYSRWGAIILFLVVVPIITFCIGTRYQETKLILSEPVSSGYPVSTTPTNSATPMTPTPSLLTAQELETWKTFKNEEYGYELMHPLNLEVEDTRCPFEYEPCLDEPEKSPYIRMGELSIWPYNKVASDTYSVAKSEFDRTNSPTANPKPFFTGYTSSEIQSSSIGHYFSFVNMLSLSDGGAWGFQTWPEHQVLYFKTKRGDIFRVIFPTSDDVYKKVISTIKITN